MPAIYDGLQFKTRLEAQWAAFFDLAGWEWRANPAPVGDWSPDFRVKFPCGHSECSQSHSLLVSVLPIDSIADAGRHAALAHNYRVTDPAGNHRGVDAGAVFGKSPDVSRWEMSHGAGGGLYSVDAWESNSPALWDKAATMVS